jgi:hypothetical protein
MNTFYEFRFGVFTMMLCATFSLLLAGCGGGKGIPDVPPTYTAILLQPTKIYTKSTASFILGNSQVGGAFISIDPKDTTLGETTHAVLWTGTPESIIDLHPSGYALSSAIGQSGNTIVGKIMPKGTSIYRLQAATWDATTYKVTNCHPDGYDNSMMNGISDNVIVGSASPTGSTSFDNLHAVIWNGISRKVRDIHPEGYVSSNAFGVLGDIIVGYATPKDSSAHAALWHNSTGQFTDLHPAKYYESRIQGTTSAMQFGHADNHAMVWYGSASSAVDIHPSGYKASHIYSAAGNIQVGEAMASLTPSPISYAPISHAMLWQGNAESAIDLHNTTLSLKQSGVPLKIVSSSAYSVDSNGNIAGEISVEKPDGIGTLSYAVLWKKN